MNNNSRIVTVKLSRVELCYLMTATTSIAQMLQQEGHSASKWEALHDNLREQLDAFDKKNGVKEEAAQ